YGLQMDIGGFIEALEYASGTKAMIIGKPSADFFNAALEDMQLEAREVGMIGDDIDSDVGGAQQAGLKGILVRTGKYRQSYAAVSPVTPGVVSDSILDLAGLLGLDGIYQSNAYNPFRYMVFNPHHCQTSLSACLPPEYRGWCRHPGRESPYRRLRPPMPPW